jgi:2-methylcitrate dehydratase PrpD
MKNALGIAEAYAPLIPEIRAVEDPAMAPKDGIAWGAMVGTSAALLAQKGFTGSPSLLGDSKRNRDVFTLGKDYKIMRLYFKRYPCCRWAHPAIDGILKVMEQENLTHREISSINIKTISEAVSLYSIPPSSLENAEYNVVYPVAVAAIYREFTPKYLEERYFNKKEIHRLMKKIVIIEDPKIQKEFPEQCMAEIELITNQRRKFHSGLISARGDFDHPLSEQELEDKFIDITRNILDEKQIHALIGIAKNFEDYHIKDLIKFLK